MFRGRRRYLSSASGPACSVASTTTTTLPRDLLERYPGNSSRRRARRDKDGTLDQGRVDDVMKISGTDLTTESSRLLARIRRSPRAAVLGRRIDPIRRSSLRVAPWRNEGRERYRRSARARSEGDGSIARPSEHVPPELRRRVQKIMRRCSRHAMDPSATTTSPTQGRRVNPTARITQGRH